MRQFKTPIVDTMENNMKLKEEIESYYNYDYTQAETVELLLRKGYSESEIRSEIFNVYTEIVKKEIVKSFSFVFTSIIIGLISLTPLIGYLFDSEVYYGIFSFLLLLTSYGYFKLNKASIIIWICILSLFDLYLLIVLFIKLSGTYVNSTYSYGLTISLILFGSMTLRNIYNVYSKNEKYKKQYKFK